MTRLRPGRSYCNDVSSYDCEAPAGFRTGSGYASLGGVHRDDLLTCAYCHEKVCRNCSTELAGDLAGKRACLGHPNHELADWLGVLR